MSIANAGYGIDKKGGKIFLGRVITSEFKLYIVMADLMMDGDL